MSSLPKRVLNTIRKHRLWEEGQSVLVAVSGGVDSMAMLHLLHQTQRAHKADLRVASINHGLREESREEVEFVGTVAQNLKIPFF